MNSYYQLCKRCIMDTTDEFIIFDEEGNCNHCSEYFNLTEKLIFKPDVASKKLNELADKIKKESKNKTYDCIVGISGGVDSAYMAYLAKKMGFRILAVHLDNGWNSELAVKNIENVVKKLQIDYQTYVIDWEEFKDLQISFLKASVANAEIPSDHAFLGALYKIANQYGIKHIFSGSNIATEGILPKAWGYNSKDLKHLKAIHKRFGKQKLRSYPKLGFYREFYYTYVKGIKLIRPLNYINYEKAEAMKIIQDELGWVYYGGKHYESVFTRFFQSYYLPVKFNIDKRRAHLATLVCSGQLSRDEALEEMKKEAYPADKMKEDIEYVRKKLDLTENDFEEIMKLPTKTYRDYPNQEKKLKFIYSIYHKLTRRI
ncbi:MAG: N-acetyl sugar amidotransferase [Flavobacteriales bacterium]